MSFVRRPERCPAFADWDGDRDIDLIVGQLFGPLTLFERVANFRSVERTSINPFGNIVAGPHSAPVVVDWDGDADLDLLLGGAQGTLRFFVRGHNHSLDEPTHEEHPFHDTDVGGLSAPSVADWDSDQDLDVLVGSDDGTLLLYEQLADGRLVERTRESLLVRWHFVFCFGLFLLYEFEIVFSL